MRRSALVLLALTLLTLAAAPAANAATRFVIKGHGWGHGIGMSQWGALGYAQHGFTFRDILDHYYSETSLVTVSPSPSVRVLLQSGSRTRVSGAVAAADRALDPAKTYGARAVAGGRVALLSPTGRKLATVDPPLAFQAPDGGSVVLRGTAANGLRDSRYRGAIEVRPSGSRVLAINALGLEDYVRGVVSGESPSSWPAAALQAQAVAARSYAVTTNVGTRDDGIDQYADVRSQVYRGVAAEVPSTDAAVRATRGLVVAYQGRPVTTFFFSTSGGHTENVEYSFIGALPRPWLRGVDDPFDSVSPRHTWGPIRLTGSGAASRLRGLVRGSFRGIKVLQRGSSPRIVRAQVLGTRGATAVSGPTLRARLGLFDTWASFTYMSSTVKKPKPKPKPEPDPQSGGLAPPATTAAVARTMLTGRIDRARRGQAIAIQRRTARGWRTVGSTRARRAGAYRAPAPSGGTLRVVWHGIAGPSLRVR
jgi:stage II sporulation protein D